ncbi:unnamed protein product [Ceutorhynchus assimilis]|uniref:Uncharacterized protein n=1 Tax=Ceutorhynchus assimilis TaxID=467358 RepID=A0A9N9MR37_9CUCU|nr:unnamed protein product [Ceutorhynchus assimilis]
MEKQTEICENYQLKWSSYTTYIHSCIASSLLSDDSFQDVALVTMDGHKIMAHRFVLSFSSLYLNKALKFQNKVTTALPIMIVLPGEITYKALKVLVKYMYSGEATVPKEILNTVLAAGETLKIKGLYREAIEEETLQKSSSKLINPESHGQKTTKSQQKSVVITEPPPLVPATNSQKIIQNKSVAIPKEAVKILLHGKIQNKIQEKVIVTSNNGNKSKNVLCNFSNNENGIPRKVIMLNKKFSQLDKPHTITSADMEAQNSSSNGNILIKDENEQSDISCLVIKEEPVGWPDDIDIVDEKEIFEEESTKLEGYDSTSNESSADLYTPLTCELCTERFSLPAEWVKHVQSHTDMLPAKRRRRDSPDEEDENASFPELQCDLCDKSFVTPAEWVRHIQDSHTNFELSLANRKNERKQVKKNRQQGAKSRIQV